ncbi:MAG: hypothetical protein WCA10_09080 [Terracidiphilus sp.]
MIVANMHENWFKKPITVVSRNEPDEDGKQFDLVCGYGRLAVFVALGEAKIPSVIIETSREEKAQRAHMGSSCEGTTR